MGFKADTSFLRFLSMGAAGVHKAMEQLRGLGFEPIELERYCGSNKIWATKVKRLRLPDLLCVKTGMRAEVRAKTDLKIRMSDAPKNPDRVWDAGLRDNDVVGFIGVHDQGDGPKALDPAVFFTVKDLKDSVGQSKLGPPKSASEGAERDRTWPAIVPSRDGRVLGVPEGRLIVEMSADESRPARRQTYTLNGKNVYVGPGDTFKAQTAILAGAPARLADLSSYLRNNYSPLDALSSANDVDRYAAVKALPYREDPREQTIRALEELLGREAEARVALEAAGSAAALGSALGQERISGFIWNNNERPELRMEAVFILTELGNNGFTRDELNRIVAAEQFQGDEIRQAAVWGLGKAGLRQYEDIFPFIDDGDENVALHAIAAFGKDTPVAVIQRLVHDLLAGDPRRAPAASEVLRIIGGDSVLNALVQALGQKPQNPDWLLATLGRFPVADVRQRLQGSPALEKIAPVLLMSGESNWLADENVASDVRFLLKQNI